MDVKTLGIVFLTVFLAELGDKTQLATMLFAARETAHPLLVFAGAALALVASSALAVSLGTVLVHAIDGRWLSWAAGAGFIAVGIWTILQA